MLIVPGQYEILPCPFCEKGRIQCLYFPSVSSERRRTSATFGAKKERSRTSETWIIQSGCSVCKKSVEEVEKELKRKGVI